MPAEQDRKRWDSSQTTPGFALKNHRQASLKARSCGQNPGFHTWGTRCPFLEVTAHQHSLGLVWGSQSFGWADQKALGTLRDSLGRGMWVYFHHFYTVGSTALEITGKFSRLGRLQTTTREFGLLMKEPPGWIVTDVWFAKGNKFWFSFTTSRYTLPISPSWAFLWYLW